MKSFNDILVGLVVAIILLICAYSVAQAWKPDPTYDVRYQDEDMEELALMGY